MIIISWKDDIEENLKTGLIEILILLLLRSEDMYGYQIVQEIARRSNNAIIIKEGSLYGPLYRLEKKKLITLRKEMVGKKRFRNYYHIEDSGIEYLDFALSKYYEFNEGTKLIENWKDEENE